jgi:hypothetical protein
MKAVEEAAGERPTATPARLRIDGNCVLRLRIRVDDWATCPARQADYACLLVIYQFPFDGLSVVGLGEGRAEGWLGGLRWVEMSNSDCGHRGLATRRGVCALPAAAYYYAFYCTLALSQGSVPWHDLTRGSDLHQAIPLLHLPASSVDAGLA